MVMLGSRSITRMAGKTSVGLWAEGELFSLNHFIRDPIGLTRTSGEKFEVRFGEEDKRHYIAAASRNYGLYQGQLTKAVTSLGRYTGWRGSYTCASWATEKLL